MKHTGEALETLFKFVNKDLYYELERISKLQDIEAMRKAIRDIKEGIGG